MGRPKGSKNKPKPLPPEAVAALEFARAHGFEPAKAVAQAEPAARAVRDLDFREFCALVKVKGKNRGKLVAFELNEAQEELDDAWERGPELGTPNIVVAKARKVGSTTYFAIRLLFEWLRSDEPIMVAYLANKRGTARIIMAMVRTALASLPQDLRPQLVTNQKTLLERENGATFMIDTARGEGGMRGETPHILAIAEACHVDDPEGLKASTIGSVPTEAGGRIILESTAKGVGDLVHAEYTAAKAPSTESDFWPLFFPWYETKGYRMRVPAGFEPTAEEIELAEQFRLDHEQLQWRRKMLRKLGPVNMRVEYPATFEEAYSSVAGQWFREDQLSGIEVLEVAEEGPVYLEPFDPREAYAAAGDCGAGVGGDHTTLVIINVRTLREVALYRSNTDAPEVGVEAMFNLLSVYDNPLVLIEYNRWGIPYINGLRHRGARLYSERQHEVDGRPVAGEPQHFSTNEKTRVEVLEGFRTLILRGEVSSVDSLCFEELRGARVDPKGKIVLPRTKRGHGDVLFAHALAHRCRLHVPLPKPGPTPIEKRLAMQRRPTRAPGARF